MKAPRRLDSALDSVLDILSLGLLFVGLRIAAKPADSSHHYGHGKAENLSVFAQTLFLGAVVVWVAGGALDVAGEQESSADHGGHLQEFAASRCRCHGDVLLFAGLGVVVMAWVGTVLTVGRLLPWAIAATRGRSDQAAIGLVGRPWLMLGLQWALTGFAAGAPFLAEADPRFGDNAVRVYGRAEAVFYGAFKYDDLNLAYRHRPFKADELEPWLRSFYREIDDLMKAGAKLIVHGEELGDRLVGIMGGYIRWAGLVDDDTQAITVTERLAGRQLDPFARNVILLAPKLR